MNFELNGGFLASSFNSSFFKTEAKAVVASKYSITFSL